MSNLKKEKQILIALFFFALLTMVIGACSDYYDFQLKKANYERVTPLFDGDTKKFGVAFGQAFKKTIRQAKAKNIRPSDKDKLNALAYDNSVEEFRTAGLMDLEESDHSSSMPAEEYEFLEDGSGGGGSSSSNHQTAPTTKALTVAQKQVFAKIDQAMSSSESYLEATHKLANINNGIPLTVPAQEQVGLQRAIAALYYTLDAIDDLVAEGVLKGQSEKQLQGIKTQKAGFISGLSFLQRKLSDREKRIEREWAFRYAKREYRWKDNKALQFADAYVHHFEKNSFDRQIAVVEAMNDVADPSWWDCMKKKAKKHVVSAVGAGVSTGWKIAKVRGAVIGLIAGLVVGTGSASLDCL